MDEITKEVERMYINFPYPPDHAKDRFWKKRNEKTFVRGCRLARWLLDLEPELQGGKLLDAGAGTGIRVIGYAKTIPGVHCTGLELSATSREHAIANAGAMNAPNIQFVQGNIMDDGLAEKLDAPFDVITSHGVLHHLSSPEVGLRNLLKLLKPGGLILICLYGKYGRHEAHITRRAVSLLEPDTENYQRRLQLARELLSKRKWLRRKVKTKFRDDAFLLDAFLHPQEAIYTLDEIIDLYDANGIEFVSWFEGEKALREQDELLPEAIREEAKKLSRLDMLRLLELRRRPPMLSVVGRKRD